MSYLEMTKDELLRIIYQYYPKGIMNEDMDLLIQTPEFQKRVKICQDTSHNQKWLWAEFQIDFKSYLSRIGSDFADYTAFGIIPSYFLEIFLDRDPFTTQYKKNLYVCISIIAPFWSFRFFDSSVNEKFRYFALDDSEEEVCRNIEKLILTYFPGYSLLPKELGDVIIDDIDTPHSHDKPVTIFRAIFVDN